MKKSKEITFEKLWNLLILLLVGEVSTAFHYGSEKAGWLLLGIVAIVVILIAIGLVSIKLELEE